MVQFLATSRHQLFVATSGIYGINGLNVTLLLPDPGHSGSHVLAREDDDVWIGSMDGLFKLEGSTPVPHLRDTIRQVTAIESDNGRVWVAVDSSSEQSIRSRIYRVDGNGAEFVAEVEDTVKLIEYIDDRLWFGTPSSAYRLDEEGPYRVFSTPNRFVKGIVEAGGEIWLTAINSSGYFFGYRWNGDAFELIDDIDGTMAIIEHDGHAWLAAAERIYRYASGEYVPVRRFSHLIKAMASGGDELVVVTSNEIYRGDILSLNGVWDNKVDAPELELSGISYTQEHVWIWGIMGLYRLDPDTQIQVEIKVSLQLSEHKLLILGDDVLIKRIRYRSGIDGSDPYKGVIEGRFGVIVETNTDLLNERAKRRENFSPWRDLKKSISPPSQRIVIRARDAYGNASQLYEYTVYVLPKGALLFLLFVVVVVLIALILYRWFSNSGSPPKESPRAPTSPILLDKQHTGVRPESEQKFDCMISYSHEDKDFASRIHAQLSKQGFSCAMDRLYILPGDILLDKLAELIQNSKMVLLICSRSSLESEWVKEEIDMAKEKKRAIISLDLDGYIFDWPDGRATRLRGQVVEDFRDWESDDEKFERAFERVAMAIRAQ